MANSFCRLAAATLILINAPAQAAALSVGPPCSVARSFATATLLHNGTVIVAGGLSGPYVVSSTELFSPATGTWTSLPSMSTPRHMHTATLLQDGRVLVVGGNATTTSTQASAEIYDPVRNTWRSVGSLPKPRYGHSSLVLPNGKVLIVGGAYHSTWINSVEIFDPWTETFSTVGSLNVARAGALLSLLSNGKVLAVGGALGGLSSPRSSEVFDPATSQWSLLPTLRPTEGTDQAGVTLRDGRILVTAFDSSDAFLFNPTTSVWSLAASLPSTRGDSILSLLPDGRALLTGGEATSGQPPLIYDPMADQWTATDAETVDRNGHTAVVLASGDVLVSGGAGSSKITGIYSFATTAWTSSVTLPSAVSDAPCVTLADGRVLLAGGSVSDTAVNTAALFDPATNTWSPTGSLVTARTAHRLALLPDGKVLAVGGIAADGSTLASAELYNPSSGTWSATSSLTTARRYHTATSALDGTVTVVGGENATGPLASVEQYNGATGTWSAAGTLYAARSHHAAALDMDGSIFVSGGEGASGVLASCELALPTNTGFWHSTSALQTARKDHSMTVLPSGTILVSGGLGASGVLSSCEQRRRTQSTWQTTGVLLEARSGHSTILLASGHLLVIGGIGTSSALASTECYQPATKLWTSAGNLSTARTGAAAALLPDQRVVVAGGSLGAGGASDAMDVFNENDAINASDRPVISTVPATQSTTEPLMITGTALTSRIGQTSGHSRDHSSSHVTVQLKNLSSGLTSWLPVWPFTPPDASAVTAFYPGTFPSGPATVTVVRDGVPSVSKAVTISQGQPVTRLQIAGPDGAVVVEGISVQDFGPDSIGGASVRRTFTVQNTGTTLLTLSGIASDPGSPTSMFTFNSLLEETKQIQPGSTARITVDFNATTTGTVTKTWYLMSPLPNGSTNIYAPRVTIQGEGYIPDTPGTISFAASDFIAHEEDQQAIVTLHRSVGLGSSVYVKVTSSYGTAQVTDFTAVSGLTVVFAAGEVSKQVIIPIVSDSFTEASETFTLTLSNPSPGAKIGTQSKAIVRIIDPVDTTAPTITLTAPTEGTTVANGAARLTGSAADDRTVGAVEYSINGSPYRPVNITRAASGLSATFAFPITPAPGDNTVIIRAIDTRNNVSASVTRRFFYAALRPLVVSADTGLGSVTAPFPGTADRVVGTRYTLTAKPKPGYAFASWMQTSNTPGTGLTPALLELPTISFVHQQGLSLAAFFTDDPFVSWMSGGFAGIVSPSSAEPPPSGTSLRHDTFGLISVTVTTTGAFTGSLKIDGDTLPLSGTFLVGGESRFGIARTPSLTIQRSSGRLPLQLEMVMDTNLYSPSHQITGTVKHLGRSGATSVSSFIADRFAYNGTTALPPEPLYGTGTQKYTMALLSRSSQPSGLTAADFPLGDGYSTGSISKNGSVTFSGRLPDNTAITWSAKLALDNTWVLYNQLYNLRGGFGGKVKAGSGLTATGLVWFRPYQSVQWYPYGWMEGVLVDVNGSAFTPVPGTSVMPGLGPINLALGNATLTFAGGLLTSPVTKALNLTTTNLASTVPATDKSFSVKLDSTSGLFSGSFTHPAGASTFQGVIIQAGANARGYGYFMSPSPKALDYLGQSGRVELKAK